MLHEEREFRQESAQFILSGVSGNSPDFIKL